MTYLNFMRTFNNDLWFAVARSTNFGQYDPICVRSTNSLQKLYDVAAGLYVTHDILISSVMAKNYPYIVRLAARACRNCVNDYIVINANK